jgi:sugar phosphate isomerase/epimerase
MSQKHTYGINILGDTDHYPITEQIKMVADVGFDAFFTAWEPEQTAAYASTAAKCGLDYYSIHAPCKQTPALWRVGEAGDAVADMLIDCVKDCADHGVSVMVVHPCIGYKFPGLSQIGLDRYARILEVAEHRGVTVGFENLEGEEYLAAVMKAFWCSPACGFCFDTGHEQCHNYGKDMLTPYSEKLCLTHINDNHGRWAPENDSFLWVWNDMHLPPGDGIVNWRSVIDRIEASPYKGPLMCELKLKPSPGRTDHDVYRAMPLEDFYALSLARVKRVAERKI